MPHNGAVEQPTGAAGSLAAGPASGDRAQVRWAWPFVPKPGQSQKGREPGRAAFQHPLVAAILVLHLALGLAYSLATPIGEGHDEWAHFAYVRYIVTERRLPAPYQRLVPECQYDETHQPPIYYLIGALASSWVDMSDNLRPVWNIHMLESGGGRSIFVHSEAERWPYRGSVLGFYVLRGVSVLMGTATVLVTYLIARQLLPARRNVAVAATAFTAFMPQLLYMGSVVNNDIAVTLFVALASLALVRIALLGLNGKRLAFLFAAMACALLSKASAAGLLPVAAIVLLVSACRQPGGPQRARALVGGALVVLAASAMLLGWWLHANRFRPGAISAGQLFTALTAETLTRYTERPGAGLWHLLGTIPGYAFRTFWAAFGWGNVPVGEWIYFSLALLSGLALVGCGIWFVRHRRTARLSGWSVLALVAFFTLLLPLTVTLMAGDRHFIPGRYFLAIAPAVGLALAAGLAELAPPARRNLALWGCSLAMLALAAAAPFCYIRPAYARPPLLTAQQLAGAGHPIYYRFGDGMELIAYETQPGRWQPGQSVTVSLYWRCLAAMPRDLSVAVQALTPDYAFAGGGDSYLGTTMYPTSQWRAGDVLVQTHQFQLADGFPSPALARIKVAVYTSDSRAPIPASDGRAQPVEGGVIFGRVGVRAAGVGSEAPGSTIATFGQAIRLCSVDLPANVRGGEECAVTLQWQALAPVDRDYTVFIHLVDSQGNSVTQADGEPRQGAYPTSLWLRGETVEDVHRLAIPLGIEPGEYRVCLGVYLLDTLERLPGQDGAGNPLPDNQLELPGITVLSE